MILKSSAAMAAVVLVINLLAVFASAPAAPWIAGFTSGLVLMYATMGAALYYSYREPKPRLGSDRIPMLGEQPLLIGKLFEARDRATLKREFRRADLHNGWVHLKYVVTHIREAFLCVTSFFRPAVNEP